MVRGCLARLRDERVSDDFGQFLGDLAMRFVFALGMVGNLNNMKKLMRAKPSGPIIAGKNHHHRATAVAPFHASFTNLRVATPNYCGISSLQMHYWVGKSTEIIFFTWGVIVLVLHLYAESIGTLPQCKMQVKPWLSTQPSCSLLVLDCYESQLNGTESQVMHQWSSFDPATVSRAVVRHCPMLEVPTILSKFSRLKELKFYNTTIIKWDESAALTETHHPEMTTLFLVRVNMSNGELPVGLQSLDFPGTLQDIEFCVTNLQTLPDNLDLIWPQYASIYLEAGVLQDIPAPLARLAPYDLSVAVNPISTIPKELFESDSVSYLSFGGTLISQLPENVAMSSTLIDLNLSDTNVSFFWPWIDSWIDAWVATKNKLVPITAANTPYCTDAQRVLEGEQTNFSKITVSVLQDASPFNWDTLKRAVSCQAEQSTWYPLAFEDRYSGISWDA